MRYCNIYLTKTCLSLGERKMALAENAKLFSTKELYKPVLNLGERGRRKVKNAEDDRDILSVSYRK